MYNIIMKKTAFIVSILSFSLVVALGTNMAHASAQYTYYPQATNYYDAHRNCTPRGSDLGLGGGVFVSGTTVCPTMTTPSNYAPRTSNYAQTYYNSNYNSRYNNDDSSYNEDESEEEGKYQEDDSDYSDEYNQDEGHYKENDSDKGNYDDDSNDNHNKNKKSGSGSNSGNNSW